MNRDETLRSIPPSDPDYTVLYPLRSDIESIHRYIDDTLWCHRAQSLGAAGQLLDLIGFSLMVNSVAIRRHRAKHTEPVALAA